MQHNKNDKAEKGTYENILNPAVYCEDNICNNCSAIEDKGIVSDNVSEAVVANEVCNNRRLSQNCVSRESILVTGFDGCTTDVPTPDSPCVPIESAALVRDVTVPVQKSPSSSFRSARCATADI